MAYDYYSRVLCPFCEAGEMRAVNASVARCSGCEDTMGHGFFDALLRIRALPQAEGTEAPRRGNPYRRASGTD
jgi:ribosomal protein L37AE/L43A